VIRLSRGARRLLAAAIGIALDARLGEPPEALHPLRAFGSLMATLERHLYRDDRRTGVLYAATGLALGATSGRALSAASGGVIASTALATSIACGGTALASAAASLDAALARGDLAAARACARSLVGRDVDALDASELARAAVESLAENTVDAVVAPLVFAAAAGAPGALAYRAVNTLDALVGYHSPRYERFGWASARLDDVANYLPARLVALLVAAVRPRRACTVLRVVRRDAGAHPSPNAGVAEAAFAAALDLVLGGANTYDGVLDVRPRLGNGRCPDRGDIAAAIRLSRHVGVAAVVMTVGAAVGLERRARRQHARGPRA